MLEHACSHILHVNALLRAFSQIHTSSIVVRDVPGFRTTPALAPRSLICSAWQDVQAPSSTHDANNTLSVLQLEEAQKKINSLVYTA